MNLAEIPDADSILCNHRRGRDRIVVQFATICAVSAYHHKSCEFESCSWCKENNIYSS
jgi:hypothetical protein